MKSVIITGAGGFIGRYLVQEFNTQGWQVLGIDVNDHQLIPCQRFYKLNILTDDLSPIFKENPEVVACIHTAGRASVPLSMTDPFGDFQSNTISTYRLLDCIRQFQPRIRLMLLSSAAVYGTPSQLPVDETASIAPLSPYGNNKFLAEEICRSFYELYGVSADILRIFSAYGENLHRQVIWDICHKATFEPVVKLFGTGNESRDFIHVEDIARACAFLINQVPAGFNLFNLGSGEEVFIKDLAQRIVQKLAPQKSIYFDQHIQSGAPVRWQADISQLKALGYTPRINFEAGLDKVINWFKVLKLNT